MIIKADLVEIIDKQIVWSKKTFGPGERTEGVTAHIEKELAEVRATNGKDLTEWVDIIILALDGAWRSGFTSSEIVCALKAKLLKNMSRKWPDWRTAGPGPIEHVRGIND